MKTNIFKFRLKQIAFVALAAAMLLANIPADARVVAQPSYFIEDLGSFGGSPTIAYGINNSGQVAGFSYTSGNSFLHAFRFNNGLQDLGALPGSGANSGAGAINNGGQATGIMDQHPGSGDYIAVRYDGNTITRIGALPGHDASLALGINNAGVVVGESIVFPPATLTRAFLYKNQSIRDLGTLGGNRTSALGVNIHEVVVGWGQFSGQTRFDYWHIYGHAFIYDHGNLGRIRDLNDKDLTDPYSGFELLKASAINDKGQIVGYGERNKMLHAFRTETVPKPSDQRFVTDLGTFPNGGISYALGINSRGDVVGAAYLDATGAGNYRAFVYTNLTGMRNLNNLIDCSLGWRLREATGINDNGQIVGWGELNGQIRAFRLTPLPAPCGALSSRIAALEDEIQRLEEALALGEIPPPPRTPQRIAQVEAFINQKRAELIRLRRMLDQCLNAGSCPP